MRSPSLNAASAAWRRQKLLRTALNAIGRRKPGIAGYRLNGGKTPTLPCQTFLSNVLSATKKLTGRRQKTATATPLKATSIIVTTPNSKATQFRASGPGRRGFAVGTRMLAVFAWLRFALISLVARMSVVTNYVYCFCPGLPGSCF